MDAIEIVEQSDLLFLYQLEETSVKFSLTGTLVFLERVEWFQLYRG